MEVNRNILITITTLKFPHWLAMVERCSPVKRDIHILLLGTCVSATSLGKGLLQL